MWDSDQPAKAWTLKSLLKLWLKSAVVCAKREPISVMKCSARRPTPLAVIAFKLLRTGSSVNEVTAIFPLPRLTGVPALIGTWAECNGQVLSDAGSPLNGVTLPDLNGAQRFLRGASASGGMGGSDTLNLGGEISVDANLDATTTSGPRPRNPICRLCRAITKWCG